MTKPQPTTGQDAHPPAGGGWRQERRERVRQLREQGLTVRQIAAQLGLSTRPVMDELHALRGTRPAPRLRVVRDVPRARPAVREVRPERAAIAYTAGRGWHMTEAPPGWLLDILAEVD